VKNDKIESSIKRVLEQHKRLKIERFSGEVTFTITLSYREGGVRTEEVSLEQKI